jgi:hypothetical protein
MTEQSLMMEGVTAADVDTQLTMMLTRLSAGEDPEMARAHPPLAFAVPTCPNGVGR